VRVYMRLSFLFKYCPHVEIIPANMHIWGLERCRTIIILGFFMYKGWGVRWLQCIGNECQKRKKIKSTPIKVISAAPTQNTPPPPTPLPPPLSFLSLSCLGRGGGGGGGGEGVQTAGCSRGNLN